MTTHESALVDVGGTYERPSPTLLHRGGRLPLLDLTRILAAMAVLFFHWGFWSTQPASTAGQVLQGAYSYGWLTPYTWWAGGVGVSTFFVISGFVIAYSASVGGSWRFIKSRVLRIWPTLLICAALTALVATFLSLHPPLEMADRLRRTAMLDRQGPWVDGVYWTLVVEVQFYAVVALVMTLGGFRWVRRAIVALGLVSTGFWMCRLLGHWGISVPVPGYDRLALLDNSDFFALGAVIWSYFWEGRSIGKLATAVVFSAAGTFHLYSDQTAVAALAHSARILPPLIWVLMVACVAIAGSGLLRVSNRTSAVLRTFGLATYPLYLLHDLVGAAMLRALAYIGVSSAVAGLVIAGLFIWGLALTVPFVEGPPKRALGQLFDLAGATCRGLLWSLSSKTD